MEKTDEQLINDFLKRAKNRDIQAELKQQYNYYLNRYYKGCNYVEEHIDEYDKYENKLIEFLNKMNELLAKIKDYTNEEVLNGFK